MRRVDTFDAHTSCSKRALMVLIMRSGSTTLVLWNRYQIALLALTEHRDRALLLL